MVSGIGQNIAGSFFDLMKLIAAAVIVIILITIVCTRWYYYDEIAIANQIETATKVCENQLQRDQHCRLSVSIFAD